VRRITRTARDRVAICDLANEEGRPIYVHAKVCIVDDAWMTIGSDNLNLRSWTHDSEVTCAMLDGRLDDREPADPAGLGDGARVLPREVRLALWREHLGEVPDEAVLDPIRGLELWRARAAALDAWHRDGRRGQRPPGRVRRHHPEPIPWWASWWSRPVHRIAVDPDGRPRSLRRSDRF
jgi:phosphatidylserine/phosphatidylglycerophosphate/cardiolipin synthase-like enzyme